MRRSLVACLPFLVCLVAGSCRQPETWTAIVYPNQTASNYREAGVFDTVQDCLRRGRQLKGDGFLECGLNCRYDSQGLFTCEKTVRLMEHQESANEPGPTPQQPMPETRISPESAPTPKAP
jgi:hypothetical protein